MRIVQLPVIFNGKKLFSRLFILQFLFVTVLQIRESNTEEFTMFEVKVKTLDGTNSSFNVEDDVS